MFIYSKTRMSTENNTIVHLLFYYVYTVRFICYFFITAKNILYTFFNCFPFPLHMDKAVEYLLKLFPIQKEIPYQGVEL